MRACPARAAAALRRTGTASSSIAATPGSPGVKRTGEVLRSTRTRPSPSSRRRTASALPSAASSLLARPPSSPNALRAIAVASAPSVGTAPSIARMSSSCARRSSSRAARTSTNDRPWPGSTRRHRELTQDVVGAEMVGERILVEVGEQPDSGRDPEDTVAREQQARLLIERAEMPSLVPRRRYQAKAARADDERRHLRDRTELLGRYRVEPARSRPDRSPTSRNRAGPRNSRSTGSPSSVDSCARTVAPVSRASSPARPV